MAKAKKTTKKATKKGSAASRARTEKARATRARNRGVDPGDTSPRVASLASEVLQDPDSSSAERSVAGSALSQTRGRTKSASRSVPARRTDSSVRRSPAFKKRVVVMLTVMVGVLGAAVAALGATSAAASEEEEEETEETETDEGAADCTSDEECGAGWVCKDGVCEEEAAPSDLCDVPYLTARAMIVDALAADEALAATPASPAQAKYNIPQEKKDLLRFPEGGTRPQVGNQIATLKEACEIQNVIATRFATWTETGIWGEAYFPNQGEEEEADDGGDGGDGEGGDGGGGGGDGGNEGTGGDEEEDAEEEGQYANCSTVEIPLALRQQVVNQLSPRVTQRQPILQMTENGFVFPPPSDWQGVRGYYADAAIIAAFLEMGESIEFYYLLDEGKLCAFVEPSQIALRNNIRAIFDAVWPDPDAGAVAPSAVDTFKTKRT